MSLDGLNPTPPEKVNLASDPYRYMCPRGHHALRVHPKNPNDRRYECMTCRRNGHDCHYGAGALVDKKARDDADDGTWCGL